MATASDVTNVSGQAKYDALIFVHGFLDSHAVWGQLINALAPSSIPMIAPDLRGAGNRRDENDGCTLEQAVFDISHLFDELRLSRVALIGHSMGAQIAELVAFERPEHVASLTLITPTPLRGNTLPGEVRNLLRESGADPGAQRGIRASFSANLNDAQLDSLVTPDVLMSKAAVRQYYDAFTLGDPRGNEPCAYRGPILVIGAQDDPVITVDQVATSCRERFPTARFRVVANSGHWPHLEQPAQTARLIANHLGWPQLQSIKAEGAAL
ncbi:alpha/beta hydrolase [Paraburkholderia sp. IMGN_8]|uniref:alpha/beta fold hydrolase n=1 Tax=Paraburkholderia sp. IMGN_8 TaxID=3136564 RepID=UPI003100D9BF